MKNAAKAEVARKLRAALDLHSAGVSLMRARLKRLHPDASDREVDQHLKAWLLAAPGSHAALAHEPEPHHGRQGK